MSQKQPLVKEVPKKIDVTKTKDGWWVNLTEEHKGQTFAALVRKYSPEVIAWKQARLTVHTGKLFLDGIRLSEPAARYEEGQRFEVKMSAPKPAGIGLLDASRILYVDRHLVVVNKPAQLVTVSYSEDELKSLELSIRGTLQELRKGKAHEPLYIAHRLDKDTSGVMVFARTKSALKGLQQQFERHSIIRTYRSFVWGIPRRDRIESYLAEDRGDGYKGSVLASEIRYKQGKKAVTHLKTLRSQDGYSEVLCRLETGRTHQIRIHLSELGHPVIGDRVYLRACALKHRSFPEMKEFHRQALHANSLGFIHPITKEKLFFAAKLASDMQLLADELFSKKPLNELQLKERLERAEQRPVSNHKRDADRRAKYQGESQLKRVEEARRKRREDQAPKKRWKKIHPSKRK